MPITTFAKTYQAFLFFLSSALLDILPRDGDGLCAAGPQLSRSRPRPCIFACRRDVLTAKAEQASAEPSKPSMHSGMLKQASKQAGSWRVLVGGEAKKRGRLFVPFCEARLAGPSSQADHCRGGGVVLMHSLSALRGGRGVLRLERAQVCAGGEGGEG